MSHETSTLPIGSIGPEARDSYPDECDPDILKNGVAIIMFAGPRPHLVEEWLNRTVRSTGLRADFYACGGRWVILALPVDVNQVADAVRANLGALAEGAIRYRTNFPQDILARELQGAVFFPIRTR